MKTKSQVLEEVLSSEGERDLCAFLKANPFILTESLQYLAHPTRVIAEFPLGTEFYADFLVVAPFSGAIELRFVEVEPPLSPFFTRDGVLSQRANKALEQIHSWKIYIEKNRSQLIRDLERFSRERDLIKDRSDDPLTCTAGLSVHHPRMTFYYTYCILMSRSATLTEEMLEQKASFEKNADVSLVSCDRLFTGAAKIDQFPEVYE
ncbi:MAG: DUF4263 domain-containing protein [Opitutaceae bacterium]